MRHQQMIDQAVETREDTAEKTNIQRANRVSFGKEFICVNKNEIWFSKISPEIKHVFVYSLKLCLDKHLMKEVFHQWEAEGSGRTKPKMLYLKDEDGVQLVWRMQGILERSLAVQKVRDIKNQVHTLKQEYASYVSSFKSLKDRKEELDLMTFTKNKVSRQKEISLKFSAFMKQINNKKYDLLGKINEKKAELSINNKRLKLRFDSSTMSHILTKSICKEARNLLRQSIIFIIETTYGYVKPEQQDNQFVFVVFQQAYQTKKIRKTEIVRILGSQVYLQKVQKFNEFVEDRQAPNSGDNLSLSGMMCCHRCMRVQNVRNLKFCSMKITDIQKNSYTATDYYSYRKVHLEGDYFYKVKEQHVLPYFEYNVDENGRDVCNRAFCQECTKLCKNENEKKMSCLYCQGMCNCLRCEKAVGLVKLIALNYKNDPEGQKKYHEILKLFGGQGHQHVAQTMKMRIPVTVTEFKMFQKIRRNCMKERARVRLGIDFELKSTFRARTRTDFQRPIGFLQLIANPEDESQQRIATAQTINNNNHFQQNVFTAHLMFDEFFQHLKG